MEKKDGKMDFAKEFDMMKDFGYGVQNGIKINIPNSKENLSKGLDCLTRNNTVWLKEYDNIVEWLTDNKGRGLLAYGNVGRGKTLILGRIIPTLIHYYYNLVVNITDSTRMNKEPDILMGKKLLYIDDIGIERESVIYGDKRWVFPEIVDNAEKNGNLLLISTNLSLDEIKEKYGVRTFDRLRTITKTVLFQGDSLRK